MPALHPSRRSLLAAGAALLASGSAGCLDGTSRGRTASDGPPEHSPESATTDFEVETLRDESLDPIVPLAFDPGNSDADDSDATGTDESATPTATPDRPRIRNGMWFLLEEAHVDALEFEREPADTGAFRSFLAGTDFENESIVVIQEPVPACYDLSVEYLEVASDDFHARRCRTVRPADVDCEAAARHLLLTALRIPHAYDRRPRSRGLGTSANCRPEIRARIEGTDSNGSSGSSETADGTGVGTETGGSEA